MKATAQIKELTSVSSKNTIMRNLSRIMDIRILDISIENNTVSIIYDSAVALEKAKRELMRIGFSILHCNPQDGNTTANTTTHQSQLLSY